MVIARRRHDLVVDWQRQEAADGPLAALAIGVEQLHRPGLARLDRGPRLLVAGRGGVPERPLPEPDVAHRYVQVPGLRLELSKGRVIPVAVRVGKNRQPCSTAIPLPALRSAIAR